MSDTNSDLNTILTLLKHVIRHRDENMVERIYWLINQSELPMETKTNLTNLTKTVHSSVEDLKMYHGD